MLYMVCYDVKKTSFNNGRLCEILDLLFCLRHYKKLIN